MKKFIVFIVLVFIFFACNRHYVPIEQRLIKVQWENEKREDFKKWQMQYQSGKITCEDFVELIKGQMQLDTMIKYVFLESISHYNKRLPKKYLDFYFK